MSEKRNDNGEEGGTESEKVIQRSMRGEERKGVSGLVFEECSTEINLENVGVRE